MLCVDLIIVFVYVEVAADLHEFLLGEVDVVVLDAVEDVLDDELVPFLVGLAPLHLSGVLQVEGLFEDEEGLGGGEDVVLELLYCREDGLLLLAGELDLYIALAEELQEVLVVVDLAGLAFLHVEQPPVKRDVD